MANTKIPVELSSTPGIVDNSNATAITIDSSENVGIGTSSPSAPLTVSKSTGYTEVTVASGSQEIDLFTNSTGSTCGLLTASNIPIIFYNNSLERMRIDSSGNVSIGTTSTTAPLRVKVATDANFAVQNTSSTVQLQGINDAANAFTTIDIAGNPIKFSANGSESMRIDSSGNVGIGGAPVSAEGVFLQTGNNTISQRGFSTNIYYDGSNYRAINTGGSTLIQGGDNHIFYTAASASAGAIQSVVERMRIDSSGVLLVNATSTSAASAGVKMQVNTDILSRGTVAGYFWENRSGITISGLTGWGGWYSTGTASHFLYSDGANRASIGRTSGTYTALSDVNKKKDFEDSTVGLAEVMQLKPKKFRMLEDADDAPKKLGFIAQDVENIIPEAYVEDLADDENEETFIGLTDRPIIAALTKAIQEQQTQIEALQSEINELKNS